MGTAIGRLDTPATPPGKPGRARDPRDTPAMRQFTRFKARHPDCVLLFRMGDFYELFDDDAVLVNRVLGLTLTHRTAGIPMAGVPYHALDGYLRKLIAQGYRVAVCDQIQDPAEAKGVVDRAVTRVLTPGTLVDETLLEEAQTNLVGAIAFHAARFEDGATLAIAEVSTGRFSIIDLPAARVRDELARIGLTEVVYAERDAGAPPEGLAEAAESLACAISERPAWTFRAADARDLLLEHYGVTTLAGFGLEDGDAGIAAAGALLRYLYETQAPDAGGGEAARDRLRHLRAPRRQPADRFVTIDATSLRSLEIERTMRSGQTAGSLLSILQRCVTPMGKRLLRQWLCFPLCDLTGIEARQAAVASLVEDRRLAADLAERVGVVQDVARIVGRISTGRASPRDLVALGGSIAGAGDLAARLDGCPAFDATRERLTRLGADLEALATRLVEELRDDAPAHAREGGIFRDGVDADLDETRLLQRDAKAWLARYQERMVGETAIPSLKVGFNRVFGYYLEVTHTHAGKVPDAFIRKQTLKNAERYITPELKTFEEKVTTAESRAFERERRLFDAICLEAGRHAALLLDYADVIARLDVLTSFAEIAVAYGYVRPRIVEAPVLDIREGRHPVLDRMLGDRFVPNDCILGKSDGTEHATLALITGPNMAGKSTAIRQAAIITLLAHTGSFVPATSAVVGLTDRIFTRIGASDELHAGHSTFMVEMTETANILNHATARSLVILDEIGRGTSTLDGLALAWAIAESIARIGCRSLFATHYHELTTLPERLPNVCNLHVTVREWADRIIFLYRVIPGRTDRSYGIHVARIAGLPPETVDRAAEVLESLTVQTEASEPTLPPATGAQAAQMGLFTEYVDHPAVDAIRDANLDNMTPLQAFELLRRLRDESRQ